ncbi:hypothetical protein LXA43DRAFT_1098140 [Ganoderma leucocontextum]|nr:hypothetical protein LXA43DRAFT_1098140 [Ganoderma leucocontextum]
MYPEPEHALPLSNRLRTWLFRTDPASEQFKIATRDILNRFWHMANDEQLNIAFVEIKQRVASVEGILTVRQFSLDGRAAGGEGAYRNASRCAQRNAINLIQQSCGRDIISTREKADVSRSRRIMEMLSHS